MLHDIAIVYYLSISVCQVGFSSDVVDNFVPISTGTSDTSYELPSYIEMIHLLKCCTLHFFHIAVKYCYISLYIFLTHSNSYFL